MNETALLDRARQRIAARDLHDRAIELAKPWDESKYPRGPKGNPKGGQFIAKGDSGSGAHAVQKKLGVKEDGEFGAKTEKAVRKFQRKHGLQIDGVVGHQTAAALAGHKNASKVKTGALTHSDRKAIRKHR